MAYSPKEIEETFNEICGLISDSGNSLRKVLLMDKMPSSQTFYKWLEDDENKSKQYACACEDRSDKIFEDILTISDATADDIIIDEDGNEVTNHNVIQRDRLRVDARKWVVSKLNPKKYGDSSLLKIADNEGNEFKVNAIFSKDLMNVPTDDSTT